MQAAANDKSRSNACITWFYVSYRFPGRQRRLDKAQAVGFAELSAWHGQHGRMAAMKRVSVGTYCLSIALEAPQRTYSMRYEGQN